MYYTASGVITVVCNTLPLALRNSAVELVFIVLKYSFIIWRWYLMKRMFNNTSPLMKHKLFNDGEN